MRGKVLRTLIDHRRPPAPAHGLGLVQQTSGRSNQPRSFTEKLKRGPLRYIVLCEDVDILNFDIDMFILFINIQRRLVSKTFTYGLFGHQLFFQLPFNEDLYGRGSQLQVSKWKNPTQNVKVWRALHTGAPVPSAVGRAPQLFTI